MTDKHEFWLELWEQNQTGWHQEHVNPHLDTYLLPNLPSTQQTIFVPLCGKSKDMLWMVEQGHRVIGVELSERAVNAFFEENQIPCQRVESNATLVYESADIEIIVGDFFAVDAGLLSRVNYIYDRAALVAFDQPDRKRYATTLKQILPAGCEMLLLAIEYSGTMNGPPFSVSSEEVQHLFPAPLQVTTLIEIDQGDPEGRFASRGGIDLVEKIYWISYPV